MAIYAVGDIQGHLRPLHHLLDEIGFDPAKDQLWIVGDLVNRGPNSLGVLRFVKNLGKAAKAVLGNHDLRLLALAAGVTTARDNDTLAEVLRAPDCDTLLSWLRHLPFVHADKEIKTIMVHAAIHNAWSRKEAVSYGAEATTALRGKNYKDFLHDIHTRKVHNWKKSLPEKDRLNFITNSLTRTRFCSKNGELDYGYKGPIGSQPKNLLPWFRLHARQCRKWRIVFGHWSTLGYLKEKNVLSLDSGCHWGKLLTMVQLDSKKERVWQYSCS